MGGAATGRACVFVAVGLAAIALAGSLLSAPSAIAQDAANSPLNAATLEAGRTLLAHVPVGARAYCLIEDPNAPGSGDGLQAKLSCTLPGVGPTSLLYRQFDSAATMGLAFQNDLARASANATVPSACAGTTSWSDQGQTLGQSACYNDGLGLTKAWTYEPLNVEATVSDLREEKNLDAEYSALQNFWIKSVGPTADPGTVPAVQSAEEAAQAAADLRAHLPSSLRSKCTLDSGGSSVNLWLGASYTCASPARGVELVSYASYRDDEGFQAAFDPKSFAKSSVKQNKLCPDSGTWSTNGKKLGRFACKLDDNANNNTDLQWTLDKRRILAEAFAGGSTSATKTLFAWWDAKGDPTP